MSKIKVETNNLELAEKVIEAAGNYLVKKASEFIKTLFVADEVETPKEDVKQTEEDKDVQGV